MAPSDDDRPVDKVVNLTKRRGFVYPSAEIYGGFRSTYDYGPLGVNVLRNVQARRGGARWSSCATTWSAWTRRSSARRRSGRRRATWRPSPTPWSTAASCKERWRADKIDGVCPNCGSTEFTDPRDFNLMFKTAAGPVEGEGATAYLRPETAQGMFINFLNVLTTTRRKPPFGIAQVGKSFRNEITPQNFVFRTREFEQMEMEFFVAAGRRRRVVPLLDRGALQLVP